MAAVTLSLGGQSAGAGDERSLFLKVFSGEVLNAYERAIKVSSLLTTRTISSGKSAQFPTTGLALARYFSRLRLLRAAEEQSAPRSAPDRSKERASNRLAVLEPARLGAAPSGGRVPRLL